MPFRLTEIEERPFAPFALLLAGGIIGVVAFDLYFWSGVGDHRATVVHTPGYGAVLLIMWLWLSWMSRDPWLRAAWRILAFNEALSMIAAVQPMLSPWWRRDVLLLAAAVSIAVWGWRHSPPWMRMLALLIIATGAFAGDIILEPRPRAPIVRKPIVQRPR
jgi:hypothetical protein